LHESHVAQKASGGHDTSRFWGLGAKTFHASATLTVLAVNPSGADIGRSMHVCFEHSIESMR
jgi:hypothetical protein